MVRILTIFLLLLSTALEAADLHVSATKNLKGVLIEISELFENKHSEWKVKLRTGKSSELGKLIANGTSTDLFVLNDEKTIRELQRKKKIENVKRFLADDLVVIGPAASKLEITDPGKLAFPELKGVALFAEKHPVGKMARKYLDKIKLMDAVNAKVSIKKNTKEVLNAVMTAEADWGIVYASDIVHAKGIKVLWKIPEQELTSQLYFAGTVTNSKNQGGSRLFLETLNSTIAIKIFENSGLRPLKY
jgi:molybdate transport system substrate-binding protein